MALTSIAIVLPGSDDAKSTSPGHRYESSDMNGD